jgi:hypothetical protein
MSLFEKQITKDAPQAINKTNAKIIRYSPSDDNPSEGYFPYSSQCIEMVRVEKRGDEVLEIRQMLPTAKVGWNQGNGVVDWINLGWQVAEEYDAKKHQEAVNKRKAQEGIEAPDADKKKGKN